MHNLRFMLHAAVLLALSLTLLSPIAIAQPASSSGSSGDKKLTAVRTEADTLFARRDYLRATALYESLLKAARPQRDTTVKQYALAQIARCQTRFSATATAAPELTGMLENRELHFKVILTDYTKSGITKDSVTAALLGGANDGIYVGAQAQAVGISTKAYSNRGGDALGTGNVRIVKPAVSGVRLRLNDTTGALNRLAENDFIRLTVRIPKRTRGLVFDMAALGIEFQTGSKEPLYALSHLIRHGDAALEEDILEVMAHDVRSTVEYIRGMTDSSMITPISGGKFAGHLVSDAMLQTTPDHIRSFLRFVRTFPGKYLGKTWKVNETYATWLINNTPLSPEELSDIFLPALKSPNPNAQLSAFYTQYIKDFKTDTPLEHWSVRANRLATTKTLESLAEAKALNDLSVRVARLTGRKAALGWAIFSTAYTIDKEDKYEEAIKLYEEARKIFQDAGDRKGDAYSLNNIASLYASLGKQEESLTAYTEARRIKATLLGKGDDDNIRYSIGQSLVGIGYQSFKLSRYADAMVYYDSARVVFRQVPTSQSLAQQASVLTRIGNVCEKRAQYDSAMFYHTAARQVYQELADKEGEADALDNIGYAFSVQGKKREALPFYEQAFELHTEAGDISSAGFSRSQLAQCYWSLGDFDKAVEMHKRAIELRQSVKNKSGEAYSWNKLGALYKDRGNAAAAIDAYEQALKLYQSLQDRSGIGETYDALGLLYSDVKDNARAIETYQKALQFRKETNAADDIAATLYNLAAAHYSARDFRAALTSYRESLTMRRETGNRTGELDALCGVGLVELILNHYTAADTAFRAALAIAEDIKNPSSMAYCKAQLGGLAWEKGDYAAALTNYQSAYALYEKEGLKSSMANELQHIGSVYAVRGDFVTAKAQYDLSYKMAKVANARSAEAGALNLLGSLYLTEGEFKKAVETTEQALSIYRSIDNPWGVANAYISLGSTYNSMGDYQTAIAYNASADSIYRVLQSEALRATPMNNTGTIYFYQGDYDEALKRFREVRDIWGKFGNENEVMAILRGNIGEVLFEQKQYAAALPYLDSALTLSRKIESARIVTSVQTILGKLYTAQKNYPESKKLLDAAYASAKAQGDKEKLVEIGSALGRLHFEQKNYPESKKFLNESIAVGTAIGSTKYLWQPLYTLGQLYQAEQDSAQSLTAYKGAAEALEKLRSKLTGGEQATKLFASGEEKLKIYESIVSMLIAQGKHDEALLYLDRAHSGALREQFKTDNLSFKEGTDNAKTLALEKDLKTKKDALSEELVKEKAKPEAKQSKEKIAALETKRAVAESGYIKFVKETLQEQPELRVYLSSGVNPERLKMMKQQIPKDAVVAAYLAGENALYIFIATTESVSAKVIAIKKKDLEKKLSDFYAILSTPASGGFVRSVVITGTADATASTATNAEQAAAFKVLSEELYNALIAPVNASIAGKEKLIVMPSGQLGYFPFQALGRQTDKGFVFLGDEVQTLYATSLDMLSVVQKKAGAMKIAAFGNPDNSLPAAELEVKDIKKIFSGSQIYVRGDATKVRATTVAAQFDVIHFATHGVLNSDAENSYLVLAGGDAGKLTIREVWETNSFQGRQLVTLSACNTAMNDVKNDVDNVSPANAFLLMGVRSVLASMWQVDDAATSLLMREFYKNLKTMDKAESLQKAQAAVAAKPEYAHPYYWAAFVLLGDWR